MKYPIYINRGRLEYDLVVAPRADPSVIDPILTVEIHRP